MGRQSRLQIAKTAEESKRLNPCFLFHFKFMAMVTVAKLWTPSTHADKLIFQMDDFYIFY